MYTYAVDRSTIVALKVVDSEPRHARHRVKLIGSNKMSRSERVYLRRAHSFHE